MNWVSPKECRLQQNFFSDRYPQGFDKKGETYQTPDVNTPTNTYATPHHWRITLKFFDVTVNGIEKRKLLTFVGEDQATTLDLTLGYDITPCFKGTNWWWNIVIWLLSSMINLERLLKIIRWWIYLCTVHICAHMMEYCLRVSQREI